MQSTGLTRQLPELPELTGRGWARPVTARRQAILSPPPRLRWVRVHRRWPRRVATCLCMRLTRVLGRRSPLELTAGQMEALMDPQTAMAAAWIPAA